MAECEDEIIGENLDYEEYDLDEEEEEALLANEGHQFLCKHEPLQISITQDRTTFSKDSNLGEAVDFHIHEEDDDDDAIIEEEEDEDDYEDSKSRDRFKSERTKVSLNEPKTSRSIPDSLDDVKTTEVVHENPRKVFNKRGRFQRVNNRNNQRMQNQQGYQHYNKFNNWEGPPMMRMPQRRLLPPPDNYSMEMYNMHGHPYLRPPNYVPDIMMQRNVNRYMMNSPQIPRMSLKRSFSDLNTKEKHAKENNKQSGQNRPRANVVNPNLTIINTVEMPKLTETKASLNKVAKLNVAANVKTENLIPEEVEYQKKLEEQKKKRAEILAKKEMRRKAAARKAQLSASPVVKSPDNKFKQTKESSSQRKTLIISSQEGFHVAPKRSPEKSNFARNMRPYQYHLSGEPVIEGRQNSFALRNLVAPPIRSSPYNPPINTSVPPPNLVMKQPPLQLRKVVARPPGAPPFIPPPSIPPPHFQKQEPSFSRNFHPTHPPPIEVQQPLYHSVGLNGRQLAPPNIPPPMNPYNISTPQLAPTQAPTITLNFPPPPLTRNVPQISSEYYHERVQPSIYSDTDYDEQGMHLSGSSGLSPETIQMQSQAGLFSQRYKWKNEENAIIRSVNSGSNITIRTTDITDVPPVKKIKKFKRIIRKNKNGEILLIKKLVLDEDGDPTGVEEVEFMHDDLIAEKAAIKKLTDQKYKKKPLELVQQRGNISSIHFRGPDGKHLNKPGEGLRKTTYSKMSTSQPIKRLVTTIAKGRPIRPDLCSSSIVILTKIPSNVTVNELKDLADDDGLEPPKSILYDKVERKCSFEFAEQDVAFRFCKKMNGKMMKMSIIHADIV